MKKLLILTVFGLVGFFGANQAHAEEFGPHTTGASTINISVNPENECASGTPATSGTLDSISYIASSTVATYVSVALYTDNGSSRPGTLIASNAPSTFPVPTTKQWATTTLSAPVTGGTIYWMCVWLNGYGNLYYTGAGSMANKIGTWDSWPATYVAPSFTVNRKMAFYATYTPDSGGGGVSTIAKTRLIILKYLTILKNITIY